MKTAKFPSAWKNAGSGEEQIDWVLYSVEASGTTAEAEIVMFDKTEAADGKDETNMTKAGELPSTQRFLIKKISFNLDPISTGTDVQKILDRGVFELTINSKRMFIAPLLDLLGHGAIIPAGVTQAVDHQVGMPYELENYIMIPGGVNFSAIVRVGATAPSASQDMYVSFYGELVRPSG